MSWEQDGPKIAGCDPPGLCHRNRYFRGKLLTVGDYVVEQSYHIARRHLVNRALHGWGVISGLVVTLDKGLLGISKGLAFDRQGRELVVCKDLVFARDSDLLWLSDGLQDELPGDRPKEDTRYLLSAHHAERGIDGVRVDDGYGDSGWEANHVCETLVFSLTRNPMSGKPAPSREEPGSPADPSQGAEDFELCRTASLSRKSGLDIDLDAPVPLARIVVGLDRAGTRVFSLIDDTYHRRRIDISASRVIPETVVEPRTGGPLIFEPTPAVASTDEPGVGTVPDGEER
jgi:hypothetical protein